MCIDICPVGALTSGTYRYQTRPWEMTYVGNPCAHCSNGCKTTLSVRNNEILRANNRDHSGINGEFLCAKGRFGYDFTTNAERIRQPLMRRNGKLEPASWEDALEEVARRLKQVHDTHGPAAIGVIGSNHTTNEENYLLNRFARVTLGTNNLDHHRTADYAGLAAALGPRAKDSLATMADVYNAPAVLLIGNDVTQQNPLVAWQIRTGVRHHDLKLYVINSLPSKIHRQATIAVEVAKGGEHEALRWLASEKGNFDAKTTEALVQLKAALEAESDVVVLFGADIQGAAIRDLVSLAARFGGKTKFMALGDYANSRGAADMGILPDRLPGYAHLSDSAERARFGKLWGGEISAKPGLTARAMMEAAVAGKLKALYVVGANPLKTFGVAQPDRLAGLELLVVHDMFLTETAQRADVVLPAASTYEKDGTLTNTAGEVQMTHRAIDPQGPRSDFDLLRILSHQLGMLGLGTPIRLRTAEAAFDEIRQNVAGYDLSPADSARGRFGTCDRLEQSARGVVRRARRRGFFFTRLSVYERHPGSLLFQAHFDERGKTDAVEFITQHPVLVVSLVKIAVLLFIVMTALAYLTWFERKVIAHIQSRWGPYNVGAHGLAAAVGGRHQIPFQGRCHSARCGPA